MTYTIGADPEVFVGENGKFISAHGLVAGNKQHPFPVEKGAVQVDGMALEFNIDPAHTEQEFVNHIQVVYKQLEDMIGDKKFIKECSVCFSEEDIKDVPLENLVLGCGADYNAYEYIVNSPPDAEKPMRTAGGHIHIGGFHTNDKWSPEHFNLSARLARAMDRHLGVYSLLWDKDDDRRSMYGKAGAFRPKFYGMEYRTLSNAWLFSKELIAFVYNQSQVAIKSVLNGEEYGEEYRDIIDSSDRKNNFFNSDKVALNLMEVLHG